jgi:hypothetical protein
MNRDRKPLPETVKTGGSDLANRTIQFCQDRPQSRAPPGFNEVLLLRPSDVWTVERREPRQLWMLWWRLTDLIEEK